MNNDSTSVVAQRRRLLASITKDEERAAVREYNRHVKLCRASDVDPAPFGVFLTEWLECNRQPTIAGRDEPVSHDRRDYNRMFDGKKGY